MVAADVQMVAGLSRSAVLFWGEMAQGQTIRTPEKEIALTSALHERPSYLSACRKAGISRAAFYDWKDDDPEFAARIAAARNQGLDALEDALVTRGLKNDTTAAIFLLKSHRREIYGDKFVHEHGGVGGGAIQIIGIEIPRSNEVSG